MYRNYTRVKLYAGGVSLLYLGRGALGFMVVDWEDFLLEKRCWCIDRTTNHRASYTALIEGLKFVRRYGPTYVNCYLENKLVVFQAKGWWNVKNNELQKLRDAVIMEEDHFVKVYYSFVNSADPNILEVRNLIDQALNGDEDRGWFN